MRSRFCTLPVLNGGSMYISRANFSGSRGSTSALSPRTMCFMCSDQRTRDRSRRGARRRSLQALRTREGRVVLLAPELALGLAEVHHVLEAGVELDALVV